jgi:MerR family copper efflux transcriptional regulator
MNGLRPNLDTLVVTFGRQMDGLTINEAAHTTGWSPRMLRYVERAGLVTPERSASGYRLYGAGELQRLRTLKELLSRFGIALSDVAFAARMESSPELRDAVEAWLEAQPRRPEYVTSEDWLRFEQEKHERLLAVA